MNYNYGFRYCIKTGNFGYLKNGDEYFLEINKTLYALPGKKVLISQLENSDFIRELMEGYNNAGDLDQTLFNIAKEIIIKDPIWLK